MKKTIKPCVQILLIINNKVKKVNAGKNYYPVSKMITTEAGIMHEWNRDIYFILGEQKDNEWFIKVYINPLVSFIWFGVVIMVYSGFNRYNKKMNRIIILTPLVILFIVCLFVLIYLLSGKDPNKLPSALLDKNVPSLKVLYLYTMKIKLLIIRL